MKRTCLIITVVAALAGLAVTAALVLGACGGTTEAATPASGTPAASPVLVPAEEPVSQWDMPGFAYLPQARSVATRWAAALRAEQIPGAGLYRAGATFDFWPHEYHLQGAADIEAVYKGAAEYADWSNGHLLVAFGMGVYEGTYTTHDGGSSCTVPALDLLAIDGRKVVHEEVFLDAGPDAKKPVTFATSKPGPKDSPEAASEVAAAVGDAYAAGDQAALRELLAPNVLFYDTALRHGVRGVDAALAWQSRTPALDEVANQPPIAGPGFAVVRWTIKQTFDTGVQMAVPGATVMEVRDGKVARLTLYYDDSAISLQE